MKVYIGTQTNGDNGEVLQAFLLANRQKALNWLGVLKPLCKLCPVAVHELDIDPEAGFQTVNVTQLNPDGTRQDEEPLSEERQIPQYTGHNLA